MSGHLADAWLTAALARADHVLLLGPGWDDVVATLVRRGVPVMVDTPVTDGDGDVTVLEDGQEPPAVGTVGVTLDSAGRLQRALAASPTTVVTRLQVDSGQDLADLADAWPLAPQDAMLSNDTWLANWQVTDTPTTDLANRLVAALATLAASLAEVSDDAIRSRDDAVRSAGIANQRHRSAASQAQTTATLADRQVSTQAAMVASLTAADGDAPAAAVARAATAPLTVRAQQAVRSLLGRGDGTAGAPSAPDGQLVPARAAIAAPGWRVAVVDQVATDWLADWVSARVLDPAALPDDLLAHMGGHLDVLVIGHADTAHQPAVTALAGQARDLGAAVVGVTTGGTWAGFADRCDLLVADDPDRAGPRTITAPAPVVPLRVNPIGYRWRATGLVTFLTAEPDDPGAVATQVTRAAGGADVTLVGAGTDRSLPPDVAERARLLRTVGGVIDVPTAHATVAEHARTLVGLCAAGVPVVAPGLPDAVRDLLGPVLAGAIADTVPDDLDDPHQRERRSVLQRRAAQWDHTTEARWRRIGRALGLPTPPRPSVSVVVATNRPDHLAHCAGELARQTYRPLEVVLGLHGPAFTRAQIDAFLARVPVPVQVVAVDGHRTLGDVLNAACHAASGSIVTKQDDDDHYGPDHVVDLVQALTYSGADIVGKGSEFVHLGQIDITIRRLVGNAESGSRSVAGGTLALRRDDLAAAGWWRRVPRGVDQALIDDIEAAGGLLHRTHGYGFVLARRDAGHTWSVDVDYFLSASEAQWRGLARDAAGLDDQVIPSPGSVGS